MGFKQNPINYGNLWDACPCKVRRGYRKWGERLICILYQYSGIVSATCYSDEELRLGGFDVVKPEFGTKCLREKSNSWGWGVI